jgi:plastocyanin
VKRLSAAAIAVLALGIALVAPSGAATTTCVWVKHTKRVVTHAKRHGKRTRVVRIKHYRTCRKVAVPSVPATAAPAGGEASTPAPSPTPPSSPPQSEPTPQPEPNALGVAADDHGGKKSYTLSRDAVRPGRLTVQLNNKGEDPHDMEMQREDEAGEPVGEPVEIPKVGPGEQTTETFEVEPGRYRMWCNLFHHAEEGMEATIEVK